MSLRHPVPCTYLIRQLYTYNVYENCSDNSELKYFPNVYDNCSADLWDMYMIQGGEDP